MTEKTTSPASACVCLKFNNAACWEYCALCGHGGDADPGYAPFVDGTWDWVCYECFENGLPERAHALALFNRDIDRLWQAEGDHGSASRTQERTTTP